MKNLQLLLLFLLSLSSFAQDLTVIDKIKFKCSYEYKYMLDTTTSKYSSVDILHLQIGSKSSKCFSYRTYQHDSIDAYGNLRETYNQIFREVKSKGWNKKELVKRLPHKGMTTYVFKNHPDGKVTVLDNIFTDNFQYEDDVNPQEWDLQEDSVKTILGHECQKATCKFRGREWTAWFALDVPISDGPWKFCGLPGLIMEVYDKGEQQYFCINGLQQVDSAEPLYFGIDGKDVSKFQKVKRTDFLKSAYEYFRDPEKYRTMSTGISFGFSQEKYEVKRDLIERE
ncbi:MAG: GLPGLI family protein [Bacteroidales bacterium]|nr:GLPGLI family protein [Bacteroidales bacterium]